MMTLDQIVSMNESQTKHLSWNKLDKSLKLKRMMDFADEYSKNEKLDSSQTEQLKSMLRDKLDKKCLHRTRDVIYNAEEEKIMSIPSLIHSNQRYTLRTDAISPLQSLAPKNKTKKNV
jgi:hypothetical protein